MTRARKALMLSAGYGRGHHTAAHALAQELAHRGWQTGVADVCADTHPGTFCLTQALYRSCTRHAPWLWGALYRLLDTADWAQLIRLPVLAACTRRLAALLEQEAPSLVVCTYPLFAYMLDALANRSALRVPYAVVVTDALYAGRAWVQAQAPLICLPDASSMAAVQERFALPTERLAAPGFPVPAEFTPNPHLPLPEEHGHGLHIVYSAHAPLARVEADTEALLHAYPTLRLTLVAEDRAAKLSHLAQRHPERLRLYSTVRGMASLLRSAHLYIGKAGAASVFEAYAAEVPMVVNYALPGQEEGNLHLLMRDGAGCYADSTAELLQILRSLLAHSAAGWRRMRAAMHAAHRTGGAALTADALERRFFAP